MGRSELTGTIRFNFGTIYLWDGLPLIPFMIGLLALAEMISLATKKQVTIASQEVAAGFSGVWRGIKDVFEHKVCFFRSAAIGTIVGVIPGIGGAVANMLAYTVTLQSSKHPETFGKGDPEGVIAPESANNAKDGGALLPTVGFGIPGSAEMAVLLGAFILHGLTPGPLLIKDHLEIVWALILGLAFSNILASVFGLLAARVLIKITRVNLSYVIPAVVAVCLMGAFAIRSNIWDVLLAVIFGFIGFGLKTFGFPIITLVMGYVLGSMAEVSFSQSLMMSNMGYKIFLLRPVSLTLFLCIIVVLLIPLIKKQASQRKKG